MTVGRGPEGNRHVPEHRSGCYHGRLESCCVLCMIRILAARFAHLLRIGRSASGHDPAGDRVTVPALHRADGSDAVDHVSGEVTSSSMSGREPDVVTVRLDDGTELALTVERVD